MRIIITKDKERKITKEEEMKKKRYTSFRNKQKGITLVALVVTIVVDLVSYDKNRKYSNLVGFSL